MAKNVSLLEFENNPQIGLYFLSSDDFVLCGKKTLKDKQKEAIEKILEVPLIEFSIMNSELVGIFMQVDKYTKTIYVHKDILKRELDELNKICDKYKYSICVIESVENTLGNLMTCLNNCVILSPELKKLESVIKKASGKEIVYLKDSEFHQAGALIYSVNSKALASSKLKDETLENIENYIDDITTINNGSAYVGSGIVANKNGILIGAMTTTIEIQVILETLEFI